MNLIELPKIEDRRGNLSFIEGLRHLPFTIKRAYWIYDVAGGVDRDAHAFHHGEEFIVSLSGSLDVVLNDGVTERRCCLNRSYQGVYVPRMTWRRMENFSTNTVVLVLASNCYDPSDYIEDFSLFKELLRSPLCRVESTHSDSCLSTSLLENDVRSSFYCSTVNDCTRIDLGKVHVERGSITVVEAARQVPFLLNRVYYLYDVPSGAERGGHAHLRLSQLIVATAGSFEVVLNDGDQERRVMLNRPNEGLLLVPGIWRTLENFSSGSVCLVLASLYYDYHDYIYHFDDFVTSKKQLLL